MISVNINNRSYVIKINKGKLFSVVERNQRFFRLQNAPRPTQMQSMLESNLFRFVFFDWRKCISMKV